MTTTDSGIFDADRENKSTPSASMDGGRMPDKAFSPSVRKRLELKKTYAGEIAHIDSLIREIRKSEGGVPTRLLVVAGKCVKRAEERGIRILPTLPAIVVAFFLFASCQPAQPAYAADYHWVIADKQAMQNFAACVRNGEKFGKATQANNPIVYRRAGYSAKTEEANWEFYRKSDLAFLAFRTRCEGNVFVFETEEKK